MPLPSRRPDWVKRYRSHPAFAISNPRPQYQQFRPCGGLMATITQVPAHVPDAVCVTNVGRYGATVPRGGSPLRRQSRRSIRSRSVMLLAGLVPSRWQRLLTKAKGITKLEDAFASRALGAARKCDAQWAVPGANLRCGPASRNGRTGSVLPAVGCPIDACRAVPSSNLRHAGPM